MKGRIKDLATILNCHPYSDSSLIIKAFCPRLGNISIIAKGWRKAQNKPPLQTLYEYELTLYEPSGGELYLLYEASLVTERLFPNPKLLCTALCGSELMANLILSSDEYAVYYQLLKDYISYLQGLAGEPIPIFWRLLLRVMKLQGIGLDLQHCQICGKATSPSAYLKRDASLVCRECRKVPSAQTVNLSPEAKSILQNLPHIGNQLHTLQLSKQVVQELNRFLLFYYQAHTHQKIKLKSLGVLEQLYT